MEDNQQIHQTEALIRLILGGALLLWALMLGIDMSMKSDFKQELAKEYGIPIGEFLGAHEEFCFFPIPHEEYYVITEMGDKYPLGTQYFGSISFEDDNVKKFCHPEIYEKYNKFLKERGY